MPHHPACIVDCNDRYAALFVQIAAVLYWLSRIRDTLRVDLLVVPQSTQGVKGCPAKFLDYTQHGNGHDVTRDSRETADYVY